ncbi:hypothetical protein A2757_01940 [Candidatus Giovannonibacteria bacterium RIFCSPHIGHO2_01_FULL_48_47]|nr:MAG: hypothetical protein A2757_01940 [Candidatus Giovannonibacteria bacterium RIFCSPHIGHO2_01_FULL_48_47]OGF67942.1 MAG: hypothetical protein A3D61_02515 [Candidatus Giovannonibacteria bacterium RIFCSPHIGHO2_02_FULL_48_15]OGF88874.1 MAG: hypothetical protein A3B26_01150 [Candidatus Giovannonibacteria bacterium RIFCSPLOWO2_01_FULL_48_47]OGF96069.1 MAG: hypothetical protein A2613_00665 [Candidatus Giovannonibacteria bacterium RIFOXYD1_FULL_48_21]HBT81214.1 hypothetical protein [Candidatus Gio
MGKKTWLILAIIIALAVFLRFFDLARVPPGLYPDEAMNGNNALEALANKDWKVFYPENNGREGLFINLQSLSLAVFGNKPWALRLVSAVFGTFTVLGLFFLSKALFENHQIALLASFFLAASFWHINFSRIGFRAIMAPFFLVWGLYFFFKFFKDQGSSAAQTLAAAFGGFLFGLGAHSYIAYRITPLLLLTPLIYRSPTSTGSRTSCFPCLAALFLFFAFLAFAPLGLYFAENPADFFGRTNQISIFSESAPLKALSVNIVKTLGMFWFYGDGNWRHNFSGSPQLSLPVGIFFFIGLWLALKNLRSFNSVFLLSWLIIALLPVIISAEGLPHALRAIMAIGPVMILAGWGGIYIFEKIKNWRPARVLFAAILLFIAFESFDKYFLNWAPAPQVYFAFAADSVELGEDLNALPKELPKYVVVNAVGVEVRGIPMPAQTIMFITDTFRPGRQQEKNIFYLRREGIPYEELRAREHLAIALLEFEPALRAEIQKNIPGLKSRTVGRSVFMIK